MAKNKKTKRQNRQGSKKGRAGRSNYLHCVAGPVGATTESIGFPDGDPRLSIVRDFRQVVTIRPVGGIIEFALACTPYGALAIHTGSIPTPAQLPGYVGVSSDVIDWKTPTQSEVALIGTNGIFNLLPYDETVSAAPQMGGAIMAPYSAVAWRPLVVTADVLFTGNSMLNGGSVRVHRFTPALSPAVIPGRAADSEIIDMRMQNPRSATAAALTVFPARNSLNLRNVCPKPEYQNMWTSTGSWQIRPLAVDLTNGVSAVENILWQGLSDSTGVSIVRYAGLDGSASITIELRSCLQLQLSPGSALASMAKSSPPASLSLWQTVANYARSIPTATIMRAARMAYSAYNVSHNHQYALHDEM